MVFCPRSSRAAVLGCVTIGMVAMMVAATAMAQGGVDGIEAQMSALDVELAAHPRAGVSDVYKFLYQGCNGPGHAIPNRSVAEEYLTRELGTLGPVEDSEELCQPLGGAPELVRIHLRPYMASGADPGVLLDAFVTSADRVAGDPELMDKVMAKAVAWLSRRGRWQQASALEEFTAKMAAQAYPAVHHSEAYVADYHPAYRVVLRELAEQHGWCSR